MKSILTFCAVALLLPSLSSAYSCSQRGLVEGTLCTQPNGAAELIIGPSSDAGPMSQQRHPFAILSRGQKLTQGVCTGTLATASMLLGPARCTSQSAKIDISGDLNKPTQTAKIKFQTNQSTEMDCTNTCINPTDL